LNVDFPHPQRWCDDRYHQIASVDARYNGKVNGLIGFRRRQKPVFLGSKKNVRDDHSQFTSSDRTILPSNTVVFDRWRDLCRSEVGSAFL
jgi:hypothetical protein